VPYTHNYPQAPPAIVCRVVPELKVAAQFMGNFKTLWLYRPHSFPVETVSF
jgi:hypothetical protein